MTPRAGTLAAVGLLLLHLPVLARAGDPTLEWRTVESAHFRVHYHQRTAAERGRAFAERVARIAEDVRQTLTAVTGWSPGNSATQVTCTDLGDGANGSAAAIPYDEMNILAFAPEPDTELGRYRDWLRLLLTHEYTHVLHLNQARGLSWFINSVLGKTVLPSGAVPGWFIEGLAVVMESRFGGGGGRVRSPHVDMVLRQALLGGTLPSLSGLTGDPESKPGGSWRYTFGTDFLDFIARRHGLPKLITFVDRYAALVLPFGLNAYAREVFGEDFLVLYDAWRVELEERALAQVSRERARGLVLGRRLTEGGEVHAAPAFSADGRWLYAFESDGRSATFLVRRSLHQGGEVAERLLKCDGGCDRVLAGPDDTSVLLSLGRFVDAHRFFRELHRVSLRPSVGEPERLTFGGRVREPDVRPDGRTALLVTSDWGKTALRELDLASGRSRTVIDFDEDLLFNQPRYVPRSDGAWDIVVSAQPDGGDRDLLLIQPHGERRWLTSGQAREMSAAHVFSGRTVVYVSDEGGIFNLHSLDVDTGDRRQVTRVLGGAATPTVSPDGRQIAYSGYGPNGDDLYLLQRDEARETVLAAAASRPHTTEPAPRPPEVPLSEGAYWGARSMWPRRLDPILRVGNTGLSSLGLTLAGSDAAGRHAWQVLTDVSFERGDANVGLSYAFFGWRPAFTLYGTRFRGTGVRFVADRVTFFPNENLLTSLQLSVPIPDHRDAFSLNAGLTYHYAFDPDPPPVLRHDPGSDIPFLGEDRHRLTLSMGFGYDSIESYAYSISPEWGTRFGLQWTLRPALQGNGGVAWGLTWYFDAYLPIRWPSDALRGHVLAFKLQGGTTGGAKDGRAFYSVGGLPQQDVVMDLVNRGGVFGSYLRGFAPGAFGAPNFHLLTTEYRAPIASIFRAPGTLPLWLQRLSLAAFSDVALLYDEPPVAQDVKVSVGAELWLSVELFYNVDLLFRLGYAHAVWPETHGQLYFVMGSNL